MPDDIMPSYFSMFVEVGIINQIGTAFLEARLPKGLLASHFGVVSHLTRGYDGATPLELARAFQVAKTTMTHTLTGLEKHGFVELRRHPKDGRSKQVWLTSAGRQFCKEAVEKMAPLFQKMADRFPPDQVAAVLPSLMEFRAVIDQLRDEES
ncbi:MarR family transcriptional regulator [Pseudovibrio sp. Tun.PSC04-5.I4]|uniref:MarR family winged helix-turn-helix transcriptional regulator n=1 Tax=Pseudovibrio sp. Tun.PSC04-5.I4 TaxID=1798213 RepID=UPI00087E64CD|nr:MarR family transcriptional regulator [Pseudovibrio sp. Tun.PSC04-5.I4]SDR32674.1 DNA-binding transcriptional regulator, MarR family [Pseudovibrio sp. Tun.PSC04-5.I4]